MTGSDDILIDGNKLNPSQKMLVLNAFLYRPTVENREITEKSGQKNYLAQNLVSDKTWLQSRSFWFNKTGTKLSSTKLYPEQKGVVIAKNVSYEVKYNLRGGMRYDASIVNISTKPRRTVFNIIGVDTDKLREEIYEVIPGHKIWSLITSKFNCGGNDGYNNQGIFIYNTRGNEALRP